MGQAVNQIEIDRAEGMASRVFNYRPRLLQALNPVDCFLNLFIEILHTEADAIESESAQLRDSAFFDDARVEFDRVVVADSHFQ